MVDIMKMENDPSVNLNNHEAKIAKEVATQFIAKRTGKMVKNQSLRRETQVMLRVAEESEAQRKASLLNLINNTMKISQITEENGLSLLLNISNQTFIDGISWGRIVSLHLFAALLAEQLRKIGKESVADKLGVWLGYCVAKRSTWIRENGNGWVCIFFVFFYLMLMCFLWMVDYLKIENRH